MRIALVDPSRTTRLIVGRMLEARGHDVLAFADELEALAVLKADISIEALITSAELGTLSGVELCWATRLLATCRRPIYVLMMSTQYDQRSLIEALDSGADDFIGKPPLAEELYARLRAAERILSMQRELLWMATTDPLTGLCNRRGFFEQATEACARVARPDGALSAIVLDIDNFKQINDSYGHETGDQAIRACEDRLACRLILADVGRRVLRIHPLHHRTIAGGEPAIGGSETGAGLGFEEMFGRESVEHDRTPIELIGHQARFVNAAHIVVDQVLVPKVRRAFEVAVDALPVELALAFGKRVLVLVLEAERVAEFV